MDHRDWRAEAANDLRQPNYSPQKLVLLHTGAMAALSVVLSLLVLLLSLLANNAGGGLGGMGTQTFLATIQQTLPLLALLATPFWSVGLQQAAMHYGQNQSVRPRDLLAGFYRWKPILTSTLMVAVLYLGRVFIANFLSGQLVVFTPFAKDALVAMEAVMEDPEADLFALMGDSMVPFLISYGLIFVAALLALALPVYYRYRFVNYILLEQPGMGGMQALFLSRAMTQGRRKDLFKLDLSFWWFFLGELLISVLCYGDVILELAGVTLPVSPMVASWLFLLLSLGAQIGLHCFAKPLMEVAWVKAYRDCSTMPAMGVPQTNIVDAEKSE